MSALKDGLLMGDFKKSLLKIFLRNFSKILARTEKYVRLEDSLMKETTQITQLQGIKSIAGLTRPNEMVEIAAIQDPHRGERIFHQGEIVHLRGDSAISLL